MTIQLVALEQTKITTFYCIDEETRLKQLEYSLSKNIKRMDRFHENKNDHVAIVGFGPSLADTWEEIRNFKTIFTCSGSHKFLLQKGFEPKNYDNWYHVEVDPHAHKVDLLGQPRHEIKYLISSVCNPKMIDLLENYDTTLWHTYDGSVLRDLPCILPRGEMIITGGSNVGLRTIVLARVLGYKNLHIFGFDNSFPAQEGNQHADFHPNKNPDVYAVQVEGRTFYTTPSMLHYAREFWHELSALPDVIVKLYGDGLLQAWAKKIVSEGGPKYADYSAIAVIMANVISDEYRDMNKKLHEINEEYGNFGSNYASVIIETKQQIGANTVLDYGCGKGALAKALPFEIAEYDPAIPGKDKDPRPADLVVCTDVLEHVEPDYLDAVLGDLARCILKAGFFAIETSKSMKVLPDGRNTHLIQEDLQWWLEKLINWFIIEKENVYVGNAKNKEGEIIKNGILVVLVFPRPSTEKIEVDNHEYTQKVG